MKPQTDIVGEARLLTDREKNILDNLLLGLNREIDSYSISKQIVEKLALSSELMPVTEFPLSSALTTIPLIGPYLSHSENYLYDSRKNLKEIIEDKFSQIESPIYMVAIQKNDIFQVFEISDQFSYQLAEEFNSAIGYVQTYLFYAPKSDLFLWIDDDYPISWLGSSSIEKLTEGFISAELASMIFYENYLEWVEGYGLNAQGFKILSKKAEEWVRENKGK